MDLSDDPDTAAMAAAMGFSNFGAQEGHPSKKRRYNPRADATSGSSAVPFAATGANDVPVAAAHASRNTDEIALDDDEDDHDGTANAPLINGPALAYTQTQIDELTAQPDSAMDASQAISDNLPLPASHNDVSLPNRPNPAWGKHHESQPAASQGHGQGQGQSSGGRNQAHRDKAPSGKPWWEGYYDPKSNMNPWHQLEQTAGLQPLGSWEMKGTAAI